MRTHGEGTESGTPAGRASTKSEPGLSTLSYRSRASTPPTRADLDDLARQARERNHACGVTGMLFYKHGRYFQWLEGPEAAVDEIWRSIRADRRHHDIVLMNHEPTSVRLFAELDMRLVVGSEEFVTEADAEADALQQETIARRVAELAIANDVAGIREMLFGPDEPARAPAHPAELMEAAARRIGDEWLADHCSSVDVAVALACLQSVAHSFDATSDRKPPREAVRRSVLVASAPRETHLIGPILIADQLRQAGWDVQVAFPKTDAELQELVAGEAFAAVTLSLSDVFTRKDRLNALSRTIAALRASSRNPELVVCAGGRAFLLTPEVTASEVGADGGFRTAEEAVENLALAMLRPTSREDAAPEPRTSVSARKRRDGHDLGAG